MWQPATFPLPISYSIALLSLTQDLCCCPSQYDAYDVFFKFDLVPQALFDFSYDQYLLCRVPDNINWEDCFMGIECTFNEISGFSLPELNFT